MSSSKTILLAFLTCLTGLHLPTNLLIACPFCSATSQTLRQEMSSMDVVGFAKLVPVNAANIDGQATFKITKIVRGEALAHPDDTLVAPYFGPGKSDKEFLVMAVKSDELLWSSPLTLTSSSREYIENVFKLPDDPAARLKFFYAYLDSPESLLSGDAYDEFAQTPYEQVKVVKDQLNKEKLWKWLNDDAVSPDRKRLYYTLLGIVADKSDAPALETRLRSTDPNKRAGLDALIGCYLTILGADGLPLIDELFLTNTKCSYGDTYAAIQALRFHGTDGGIISRDKLLPSFRIMLARPDYADLVIPDLARWEDWTQIERLTELFIKADNSTSWVRVPVINYLRICPLPEAKEKLAELEKLDPKAFQRASTYFPLPATTPAAQKPADDKTTETKEDKAESAVPSEKTTEAPSPNANENSSFRETPNSSYASVGGDTPTLVAFLQTNKLPGAPAASTNGRPDSATASSVNQVKSAVVTLMASGCFTLALGLILTGKPWNKSRLTQIRQLSQRLLS